MQDNIPTAKELSKLKIKVPIIRDTIFIGHANPEDNEFTLWLREKLVNEGYKVECDLTCLIGGESDYWKTLQDLLEKGTVKYLLVFSKNTFSKQGVIDEWEQTKAIAAKYKLSDFRIVCKIDDVEYHERIGLNVMNHIRFDISWSHGLKQLLNKLKYDNIPRGPANQLSMDIWFHNRFSTELSLKKKREHYYSNWFEIPSLPAEVYFHEYHNEQQAKLISSLIDRYPAIQHDKFVISFLKEVPVKSPEMEFEIESLRSFKVKTEYYQSNQDEYAFPGHVDMKRFMVRLLRDAFFKLMSSREIAFHSMSQRLRCYYYQEGQLRGNKTSYVYNNEWQRPKQVLGDYFESMWHYGISIHPILRPFPRFVIKGHLVFSDDGKGKTIWNSKSKMQSARKSKGKSFFNADWRNLMLTFMHSIGDDDGIIHISMSPEFTLELSATPVMFVSTFGYEEPHSKARLIPLDADQNTYMEEEELFEMDSEQVSNDDEPDDNSNEEEI